MSNSIEEKEVCFDVAKTECKETTESVDTEICTYTYQDMEVVQPAKTIEVKFEKKCQTQMVTVCEPGKFNSTYKSLQIFKSIYHVCFYEKLLSFSQF